MWAAFTTRVVHPVHGTYSREIGATVANTPRVLAVAHASFLDLPAAIFLLLRGTTLTACAHHTHHFQDRRGVYEHNWHSQGTHRRDSESKVHVWKATYTCTLLCTMGI